MAQSKKTKKRTDPNLSRRKQQLSAIQLVLPALRERLRNEQRERERSHEALSSVSEGLYDEVDKLNKKAPAEPVTPLVLEQVNEVICDTRTLAKEDQYVQRQKEFVPAGDNPENRDVLVVLRMLRQGLNRYRARLPELKKEGEALVKEAETIQAALELYVEDGRKRISSMELRRELESPSETWLTTGGGHFDFDRLDDTDLSAYFGSAS